VSFLFLLHKLLISLYHQDSSEISETDKQLSPRAQALPMRGLFCNFALYMYALYIFMNKICFESESESESETS
jgi:hypothetical protein